MADEQEAQIARLLEIAARSGQLEALQEWLATHPQARILPWILSSVASGRTRIVYPEEKKPRKKRGN